MMRSSVLVGVCLLVVANAVHGIRVNEKLQTFVSILEQATSCENDVTRGDCGSCLKVPHCGYCADDDSCHTGSLKGPLKEMECKSWHFSKCDAVPKCEEIKECGECLAQVRCGWCATEDPEKISCMPAFVGADKTFRRPDTCRYDGKDYKNLWFHSFDANKTKDMCQGRLSRDLTLSTNKANAYWKQYTADQDHLGVMIKTAQAAKNCS